MLQQKAKNRRWYLCILLLLAGVFFAMYGHSGTAAALTRSYKAEDSSIKVGMVVAAATQKGVAANVNSDEVLVVKASQANANLAIGIVTTENSSKLTYSDGDSNEIFVTDGGQVIAYVSDVNGVPKAGELLVPSPLSGILMRAGSNNKGIVGAMVGSYPTKTAQKYDLKDGKHATIAAVTVDIETHPANQPSIASSLQSFVNRITGHPTTAVQIIAAFIIVTVTLIIAGSIVYGLTANYLTALGRNPLAAYQLRRVLLEVVGITIGVVLIGGLSSWAVLWL